MRRRSIATFVLLALCSTAIAACDPAGPAAVPDSSPFHWISFGSDGRTQVGHLTVPIDYHDPSKGTFDLYVARHLALASQRVGSLLVNPGGPGFGGSDFAINAAQVYSQNLVDHFDIVGWDPRGTGLSTPAIDCVSDYDHFYATGDITPDTPAERQQLVDLQKEFAADCAKKNPVIEGYVGTNNSARDMDAIRAALGEAKISYFGFSYGSELGATWATLFPDTVRAAVLDGAVDPTADLLQTDLQQAAGFEHSLDTFLAQCSTDATCAFHHGGHADTAFDALMQRLDEHPVPSEKGRPDVNLGVAMSAVAQAMYSNTLWPRLAQALAAAEGGDGKMLLSLFDEYYQRADDGTWDNSLEAFQVISCDDDTARPTVAEDDATAAQFQKLAPRFSPGTTGTYFCTFFPPSIDPRVAITGKGAGPILVMGTTGDPATPIDGTRTMARSLEGGRLVVVKADQHTGYGVNQCTYDVVDEYLIDPVHHLPADGATC